MQEHLDVDRVPAYARCGIEVIRWGRRLSRRLDALLVNRTHNDKPPLWLSLIRRSEIFNLGDAYALATKCWPMTGHIGRRHWQPGSCLHARFMFMRARQSSSCFGCRAAFPSETGQ